MDVTFVILNLIVFLLLLGAVFFMQKKTYQVFL